MTKGLTPADTEVEGGIDESIGRDKHLFFMVRLAGWVMLASTKRTASKSPMEHRLPKGIRWSKNPLEEKLPSHLVRLELPFIGQHYRDRKEDVVTYTPVLTMKIIYN